MQLFTADLRGDYIYSVLNKSAFSTLQRSPVNFRKDAFNLLICPLPVVVS